MASASLVLLHLPQFLSNLASSNSSSSGSSSGFEPVPYFRSIKFGTKPEILLPGIAPKCYAGEKQAGEFVRDLSVECQPDAYGNGANHVVQKKEKEKAMSASDSHLLNISEPVYEVLEVKSDGVVKAKKIRRRQLVNSTGIRLRDVRSIDPSLWLTNSMPSLVVREQAILLNLGSLRAIAMPDRVLVFDYNCKGGKAFLKSLLPQLNSKSVNGGPAMCFELEVVEAALLSRIQRLEQKLIEVEPHVVQLLEHLPSRLTAGLLEQLRRSKQTLVELGSQAEALKQMLLDLLDDPDEIRRICVLGRNSINRQGNNDLKCSPPLEKQTDEEEEEIEMLLENYLRRCESCHGQTERLLDSAREMEDSIAVNLSSRRLEVSRVELLLQVATFCVAVGALVAGIFGMNLRSYLEQHAYAFWLTTGGIIVGAVAAFVIMNHYLKARKIL